MKKLYFLFLWMLFIVNSHAQNYIINDVNIIDILNDKIVENQYIEVVDGKIVNISNSKIEPKNTSKIIDGKNQYIMPGMIDMHAHLPGSDGYKFKNSEFFFNYIANGVTTVRSMRGSLDQLKLRDSIRKGLLIGPSLVLGSVPISSASPSFNKKKWAKYFEENKEFDFYKYLYLLNKSMAEKVYSVMPENGVWLGHCLPGGLKQSIDLKMRSVEHIDYIIEEVKKDSNEFINTISEMVKSGTGACPDMYWYYVAYDQIPLDKLLSIDYLKYATKSVRELWIKENKEYFLVDVKKNINKFIKDSMQSSEDLNLVWRYLHKMNAMGVDILLSPASGYMNVPGFTYYDEMLLFKNAGFSNRDILKMATYNAAKNLAQLNNKGQVKIGYDADLILLDANPLIDLSNVRKINGVFYNSTFIDKKAIEKGLKTIEENNL